MKKKFVYFLMLAVVVGTIYSCAKTNKRKLSNDWVVESMSMKTDASSKYYNPNFSQSESENNESEIVSGNSVILSWSSSSTSSNWNWVTNQWEEPTTNSYSEEASGTVNSYTFEIEKDGTWKMSSDYTFNLENDISVNLIKDQSGTWSFLGKSDDFKKNERVVFDILSSTDTYREIHGGASDSETYASSFSEGENTIIFTVDESSRKELELSYNTDSESSTTYSYAPNYVNYSSTMTAMKIKMVPAE